MSTNAQRIGRVAAIASAPVLLVAVLWLQPPFVEEVTQPEGVYKPIIQVPAGVVVEQTFRAKGDHIDGAAVMVAGTVATTGTATIAVRTVGAAQPPGGGPAQRSAVVRVEDITEGMLVSVRFPPLPTRPGQESVLSVTFDPPVLLASAGGDVYRQGDLRIGGAPQSNDLIFRIYRGMEMRDLARPLVDPFYHLGPKSPVWVAALGVLLAALAVSWAVSRLLRVGEEQD